MSKTIVEYSAKRITYESSRPVSEVLARLDAELNRDKGGPVVYNLLRTATKEEELVQGMKAIIGDNDFVYFYSLHYSGWLAAYLPAPLPSTTIYALGNPIIAQTMLKYTLTGTLNIPPQILVLEKEDKSGTRIIYDLPSSRIAIDGNEELRQAAEVLDAKLEALVQKVLSIV